MSEDRAAHRAVTGVRSVSLVVVESMPIMTPVNTANVGEWIVGSFLALHAFLIGVWVVVYFVFAAWVNATGATDQPSARAAVCAIGVVSVPAAVVVAFCRRGPARLRLWCLSLELLSLSRAGLGTVLAVPPLEPASSRTSAVRAGCESAIMSAVSMVHVPNLLGSADRESAYECLITSASPSRKSR